MTNKLFQRKGKGFKWHAWVNSDGVCFTSRAHTTGDGLRWEVIVPNIEGKTINELKADGFKEAKTTMTQEQLSKGWLLS